MTPMQLKGHGSYWKAKFLKIKEFQFFEAVIEIKRFFLTGITPRDPNNIIKQYKHSLVKFRLGRKGVLPHNCRCLVFERVLF